MRPLGRYLDLSWNKLITLYVRTVCTLSLSLSPCYPEPENRRAYQYPTKLASIAYLGTDMDNLTHEAFLVCVVVPLI